MAKKKTEVDPIHLQIIQTGELAAIVGKSDRWIRQMTTDGVLKQVSRGKYVLSEAIQAFIEHASGGKEDDKKPRLVDHKTEHERIKAERAALELEELRGNLHHTADIEEALGELLIEFRKRVLALPPKLAGELAFMTDAKEVRRLLITELSATMQTLARYDPGKRELDEQTAETDA